jgi:hypothetical protein
MSERHRTQNAAWLLSGLLMGCSSATVKTPSTATPGQNSLIEVEGRLLAYEDEHFWCTYEEGAPMQAHDLGESPWGRLEITSPAARAGRTFEVLFKCGFNSTLVSALRTGVGSSFILILPEDFLLGTYSSIEDCDVAPAVAKRWRPVNTAPRRPQPNGDSHP